MTVGKHDAKWTYQLPQAQTSLVLKQKPKSKKCSHAWRERGFDKNKIRTQKHHVDYYNSNKITQTKYKAKTLLETNKLCSQSTLQLQFIIFSGRVTCRSLLSKSTYSTIIWSSMIANTHLVPMSKTFQPDTQKDRGSQFRLQHTHLKGDVNNNNSTYLYSTGHMCLDHSSPHDACQRRKIKKEQKENFDSLHKSKYIKVKDRPFAEGSRGCHALICSYAQPLSAK